MPSITALLHTENDAPRLGRCLETLYPCDYILVVDHGSRDGTVRLAREYGAHVIAAAPGTTPDHYLRSAPPGWAAPGWLLSLDPRESLTESLAASLFELKSQSKADRGVAFSVFLREETANGWLEIPAPQTRLVPHTWKLWDGNLPLSEPSAVALEGELLRFVFP
jgi:cellulose synthase/poly-beta-1,6-N-acetylglucosamine synthase-like glycosyltransferase